nr:hypothetical protein [Pseudomonas sp.]
MKVISIASESNGVKTYGRGDVVSDEIAKKLEKEGVAIISGNVAEPQRGSAVHLPDVAPVVVVETKAEPKPKAEAEPRKAAGK